MTPDFEDGDAWPTAIRALAQHVVLLALVRTHPDRSLLSFAAEGFAEATRALLLASKASDTQIAQFERALHRLLDTPSPSDPTESQR